MRWKPIEMLTAGDLQRTPVWELRYEGDVEMVRPTRRKSVTDDTRHGFIVLTRFVYPGGAVAFGYSSPQDPSGMDYIQPTVITETGHWNLFTGKNMTQKPDALLFPLMCESLVKCD